MKTFADRVAGSAARASVVVAVVLVLGTGVARALPIKSFPTPRHGACTPYHLAMEPEGNLWFSEDYCHGIGRMTPSGKMTVFTRGISGEPTYITAGPDGNMWFTEERFGRIGRITPKGTVTEFRLPSLGQHEPMPTNITTGPDGNLWFDENQGLIGRITPQGVMSEFSTALALPPEFSTVPQPLGIATGPDGNLWFGEGAVGSIGQITPTGVISQLPIGGPHTGAAELIEASNGTLWFLEPELSHVGLVSGTGGISHFEGAPISEGLSVSTTTDGSLWVATDGELERITPAGAVTHLATCNEEGPSGLTSGPEGDLWFIAGRSSDINRLNVAATIAELQRDPQDLTVCEASAAKAVHAIVACSALSEQPCEGTAKLTTIGRRRRGKLVAVSAEGGAQTNTLVLGLAHYSVNPGTAARIQVAINGTGHALVRRFRRIPITLTLTTLEPRGTKAGVTTKRLVIRGG
jgi:streptogramin lyase